MSAYHDRKELLSCASSLTQEVALAHSTSTIKMKETSGVLATEQSGQVSFWMRPKSSLESAILHALKSRILSAEMHFPGSGEICALVCFKMIQDWIKREHSGENEFSIRNDVDVAIADIEKRRLPKRRLQIEDLPEMLRRVPVSIRGNLIEIIASSTLGSVISVKRTRNLESSVRVSTGCRVHVSNIPSLTCSSDVINPRIAIVDGTIDSVGQIHRILDDSCNNGTHYIIGCRGVSEDVVRTISVNCERGTVRILLFLSRLDDLTVGALDDLAACTGAWIINAQGCESLTTGFDRLVTANGRFWSEDGSIRMQGEPPLTLTRHIEQLRSDAESGDQTVKDFLTTRILGMSSRRIEVFLGESDMRSHPVSLESIDSDIRSLVASLTKGVSSSAAPSAGMSDRLRKILAEVTPKNTVCAGSLEAGWQSGLLAAKEICSIGFAVII